MPQFRVTISDEANYALGVYLEIAGANRSGVIETLINEYLGDLAEQVGRYGENEPGEDEPREEEVLEE